MKATKDSRRREQMTGHYRFWVAAGTAGIILLAVGLVYLLTSGVIAEQNTVPIPLNEKVAINQASFDSANPNTLLVNFTVTAAQSIGGNVTFHSAVIKKPPSGDFVAIFDFSPISLPTGVNKILTINTEGKLASRQYYTVILITRSGGTFSSGLIYKP